MSGQNHIDTLIEDIARKHSPIAVGLDTRLEYLPADFRAAHSALAPAEQILAFNTAIIDALCDIVPAVKIQSACYEMIGPDGMQTLKLTAESARSHNLTVIIDAKRGDIGETASAYSSAFLASGAQFEGDMLTVNPYFGYDGVKPFLDDCAKTGRGVFALVKTSNPSSGEFQDLALADGRKLYEAIGDNVAAWGRRFIGAHGYSSVGAVVGATYPAQGALLRKRLPSVFFLVPGYGAQGATAADIAVCFDKKGTGAIVNASRSLICAHKKAPGTNFVDAARTEAIKMRDAIRAALKI